MRTFSSRRRAISPWKAIRFFFAASASRLSSASSLGDALDLRLETVAASDQGQRDVVLVVVDGVVELALQRLQRRRLELGVAHQLAAHVEHARRGLA